MKFCLDTIIIAPENADEIKNAVILLHGYGGDGKDISLLTLNWRRFLKNTVFLCPNGHEKCDINPIGFQWFDLSKDDEEYILKKSLEAENIIKKFIEQVKSRYKLSNSKIVLSGFSQGCMMSINAGMTSDEEFSCIVGFSGKIIDENHLEKNFFSKQNIFLLHGDKDNVVPTSHLLEAKLFFSKMGNKIKTKILKNCDHRISVESSSLALEFIKKNI